MTRSPLWREFESGDTFPLRILRFAILAGGILFLGFAAVLDLNWQHQLVLAVLTLSLAIWIDRGSKSYQATLTLMLLSAYSTLRYACWRISTAVIFLRDPGAHALDAFLICLLLLAEGYAFVVLLLGYLQMLWPLHRAPVPLPDDPEQWPAVDLLIPTYDEPLSVVRFTALAAMNIDWPADKLNVYILDDGRREEFRAFAAEAGIGYMSRDNNQHAKAGNINYALERIHSPFVAVFDCDHVPTRSFLQLTMGWLVRDLKLAMLQTPHHFYSPDPFERNLDHFRAIPNEDALFYGVVQDGNDFWNATSFCGSCAVLRRAALDQVGGMAVETASEDAHTSLRLQTHGWNTAYINIPQAAGLATERLSGHIRQRIRWARGMVQILRLENPLFAPGLTAAQRLCYFNAMSHFLYALPRLIFLTAPLIYLIFGLTNIPGLWIAIAVYAIPHLALSNLAGSRLHGRYRHSFWNEIFETVLAPYILLPTLLALVHPRGGEFNVTAKGGTVDQQYFDARVARPYLFLLALNLFGLGCAIPRLFQFPTAAASPWASLLNMPAHLYSRGHAGTVWVNILWTLFNLILLGVATAVAWESQQRRRSVRVTLAVPSDVILADGSMIQGLTADLSGGGVCAHTNQTVNAKVGDSVSFVFPVLDGSASLPATVVGTGSSELRAQFNPLSLREDEALTMLLYSRADAWLRLSEAHEPDQPVRSLVRILRISTRGLLHTLASSGRSKDSAGNRLLTGIAPVLFLTLFSALAPPPARAAETASPATPAAATATFADVFPLSDAGATAPITLHGVYASHSLHFAVAQDKVVKTATLKLRYHFSPGLLAGVSHLNVSLNGTLVSTFAMALPAAAGPLEVTLNLPPALLVHDNQLTFEFIGHYVLRCEDPANSTLWARIDSDSTIELAGVYLPLTNDLSLLPLPFYDSGVNPRPAVPIVFLSPLSPKPTRAAGIVASWLGVLYGSRPLRFPVSFGTIPKGNVILIAEKSSDIPASLGVGAISGPTITMAANPSDPTSSALVLTGDNPDAIVMAAMSLALHADTWQGPQTSIQSLTLPAARQPDDAPRWLSTDSASAVSVGQFAQTGDLQGDGSAPFSVTLRLPPDLHFGEKQNLPFHLSYRYNGVPLGDSSTLQVYVNGAFVSSTPLPHQNNASAVLDTIVPIPVDDLRPFTNILQFQFVFQPSPGANCAAAPAANLQGVILKDSYLDLSGIPHWTALPNLELFANAGYPFTRKADLADTVVVLPDQPTSAELEMFLTLMGHFGAQSGYPALNLSVTGAAGMSGNSGKDYLILGTIGDQPALRALEPSLPVAIDTAGLHLRDLHGVFDRFAWWRGRASDHGGQLNTDGGLPDALIEGIEWPAGSGRTAVLMLPRDQAAIPGLVSAFLAASQSPDISESVSVLHGVQFSSYRIGPSAYRAGNISTLTRATILFQEFPWLIGIVTVILCFLMAALLQSRLRRHARRRLQSED